MHHHIDSCILLEILLKPKKQENVARARFCEKHLYDLKSRSQTPILCLAAIGEVLITIYETIQERRERETTLCLFLDLLDKYEFDFTSLNHPAIPIIPLLLEIEPNLDPTDSQLLACALQKSAESFATFDQTINFNKKLTTYLKENNIRPIAISERGIDAV
ncbi:MAG: hypothetical protein WC595_01460 [Candidatus Nanoarchaeia archaeon]